MKKRIVILIPLFLGLFFMMNLILKTDSGVKSGPALSLKDDVLGVVILDDLHNNDYSDSDELTQVQEDITSMGYVPYFVSEIGSWNDALQYADYFIISTPRNDFTSNEMAVLTSWLENGSHNILLSSRGDYSSYARNSINDLLTHIGSHIRVQDDSVYTTDSHNWAGNEWYVHTGNFNTTNYPQIFTGLENDIEFFSGDSLRFTDSSTVHPLVFGEPECYQLDFTPPLPETIYDDTNDNVGGEKIPLAALEQLTHGSEADRIIVLSSTIWSDYDYEDDTHDDIIFFGNILNYFNIQTVAAEGTYIGPPPDFEPPVVKITFPRDDSIVFGKINITMKVTDKSQIISHNIYINNDLKSSNSHYLWDTTTETDGENYNITAVAVDAAGFTGKITHFVTVDNKYEPRYNDKMKVMVYNIKESGISSAWIDVVKEENADILILVETGDFDDNSNELLNKYLADLNSYFIDQKPYEGYSEVDAEESWQGIAIFSRFNIKNTNIITSVILDNGNSHELPLSFIEAKLDINGSEVYVIGIHLTCCSGIENEEARLKEMEGIINYMDNLEDMPIIFAGDFNSYSPEDTGNLAPSNGDLNDDPITTLLDPQTSKVHQWTDVFRTLNPTQRGETYPSYNERIDFIFVNQYFTNALISSTAGDTESALIGSDHYSVDVIIDVLKIGTEETSPDGIPGFNFSILILVACILSLKRRKRS